MIRDWWMCMIISVMFEFLEYSLEHQLPNFSECWWDHVSKTQQIHSVNQTSLCFKRSDEIILSCCSGSWMCCCVTGWAFTAAWRHSGGSPWSRISGRDCGTSQHTSKNTWNLSKDLSAGKTHWTLMTPCNFCVKGGKLSESPSSLPRTAGWSLNGVRRLTCDDGWRCWVLFSWWVTWLVHIITAQWFWNIKMTLFSPLFAVLVGRAEYVLSEVRAVDASGALSGAFAARLLCERGRSGHAGDLWLHGWSVRTI